MIKLLNQNAVIIAQNLNPSIFTQLWLVKQNIFEEHEFQQGCLFSPAAVNAKGANKDVLIVPERLQVTVLDSESNGVAQEAIRRIITALPHTPYKAVGFNFTWISSADDAAQFPSVIRKMFVSETNPLAPFFLSDDARFGVYMSTGFGNMRLRLEIKPLVGDTTLRFDFNFHQDLSEDRTIETIIDAMEQWDRAKIESQAMVMEASKGWSQ